MLSLAFSGPPIARGPGRTYDPQFRSHCAGATLLRNEKPCRIVWPFPWPALRHHCYKVLSRRRAWLVAMNVFHGLLRTFVNKVHAYIVLNEFSKEIMLRAGLPEGRVHVKPNFVMDPSRLPVPRRRQVVFAGSDFAPKGVHLLLQAGRRFSGAMQFDSVWGRRRTS